MLKERETARYVYDVYRPGAATAEESFTLDAEKFIE